MVVEELRPCGGEHEQRTRHALEQVLDELEQRLLGPVEVFDQDCRRSLRRELRQQLGPRILEAVARDERV